MDELDKIEQGTGALAEMTLIFFRAILDAGATEDEAYNLTSLFLQMVMYKDN